MFYSEFMSIMIPLSSQTISDEGDRNKGKGELGRQ